VLVSSQSETEDGEETHLGALYSERTGHKPRSVDAATNNAIACSMHADASSVGIAMETIMCPVCGIKMRMTNEAFNHHLDICSNEMKEPGPRQSDASGIKEGQKPDTTYKGSGTALRLECVGRSKTETESEVVKESEVLKDCDMAPVEKLQIGCPVCGKSLAMTMQDFNAHLDSCLSMSHIATMSSSSSRSHLLCSNKREIPLKGRSSKSKKKKKQKQPTPCSAISVESFFEKVS
jgi:hypothetical protein